MAKTEEELKAVVPGNTRGKNLRPLCIRSKLPPQERDSSCGGGRGSENGMAEDLSQNQGNRVKENWELAEEVGTELSSRSLDNEKPQECGVCMKKFPSRKSLYGHMRLHPDRGWRGVQPPDEEVEPDLVFDYPQAVIPGWSVTGKRGRRSPDSVTSGLNSASVKAGSSTQGNTEEVKRGDEARNRTVTKVESEISHEKMPPPPEDPRGDKEEARGKNSCIGREDKKLKGVMKRKARELNGTGRGRHAKKAAGDTSGRASAANHTCSRCHKSFPCFQALGGHRSSCNKTKQSTTDSQATNANTPGMWPWQPRLDLSLSLFTPGSSSTSNAGCNNLTDFHPKKNEPPSTEESEDNEPNMIKFL